MRANSIGGDKMKEYKIEDLIPSKLMELTLMHSYSIIAEMHGVTRQHIHGLLVGFIERGEIPKGFPKNHIIGRHTIEDKRLDIKHNLYVLSINRDEGRLMYFVNDSSPRWINIQKSDGGYYFIKWGVSVDGKIKRYTTRINDIEILQVDKWMK